MVWLQNYDPLRNPLLSTIAAGVPVVVLLGSIALLRIRIHVSAVLGLATALFVAIGIYGMPLKPAIATVLYGAAYGLFPIGWIILNLIFLYQLTVKAGLFGVLRESLSRLAPDPRIQVILIAFCFGAFFEGAAGFGTPVAVTAAILIQLGFKPLAASGLSLIANTAPVAFGALGTPIIALSTVTGINELALAKMVGRQLPFFSLLIPFWVVWAMAGFKGMMGIWPAALTAGLAFAIPQFLVSNFHGPWLVDVVSSICSMAAVAVLLKVWRPSDTWKFPHVAEMPDIEKSFPVLRDTPDESAGPTGPAILVENRATCVSSRDIAPVIQQPARNRAIQAWAPWLILSALVFFWGVPAFKTRLDKASAPAFAVLQLHNTIQRAPPIAPASADKPLKPESAIYKLNWLSATGTGVFLAAILSGFLMGFGPIEMAKEYGLTLVRVRFSMLTIAAMLALGYVTRYSGIDATLGLALAHTGWLYPFFGTMLGWLGVALTGSDTASNFLFGSLQTIAAGNAGVSPTLMAAANSSGGVMGKMVDAQSIVVASTATQWYGHEGNILRYVFFHSLALAMLMGILVLLQAYVFPFNRLVAQ